MLHQRLALLRVLLCAVPLVPLAACGDGKEGSSFTTNSSDARGKAAASNDGANQATIDTPFFKGKVTLPKLKLDAIST